MNDRNTTTLILRSGLVLGALLALGSASHSLAAPPAPAMAMTQAQMTERCEKMKEQKDQMRADMKVHDDKLMAQIAEMNKAPDGKKVALMADIITHVVEQRIAMDARKAKMEDEMMQHMMQHAQMGPDSMPKCPMMQGMQDMKDKRDAGKSDAAHEMHQSERK